MLRCKRKMTRWHQFVIIYMCIFVSAQEESDEIVIEGRYPDETQYDALAAVHPNHTWPNAIIPYRISKAYDKEQVNEIKLAMQEFERKTCIRFSKRKNENDYIVIAKYAVDENGEEIFACNSNIGRTGQGQPVLLADECFLLPGTVKHELMHAIGFSHEQSRLDRDDYVTIHHKNILSGMENNFEKKEGTFIPSLNTTYDLKSIMHYKWNALAIDDRKPTITANDGSIIEHPGDFSRTDILYINRLYKCDPGKYKWRLSNNGQVQQAENCSFYGQDIRHQESINSKECTSLCLANPQCTHFTWDSEENCYLSTNATFIDIYPYKGSICGHKTQRNHRTNRRDSTLPRQCGKNQQIKWATDCDFLRYYFQKSTHEECGLLCLSNPDFSHFVAHFTAHFAAHQSAVTYSYKKAVCGYIIQSNF